MSWSRTQAASPRASKDGQRVPRRRRPRSPLAGPHSVPEPPPEVGAPRARAGGGRQCGAAGRARPRRLRAQQPGRRADKGRVGSGPGRARGAARRALHTCAPRGADAGRCGALEPSRGRPERAASGREVARAQAGAEAPATGAGRGAGCRPASASPLPEAEAQRFPFPRFFSSTYISTIPFVASRCDLKGRRS